MTPDPTARDSDATPETSVPAASCCSAAKQVDCCGASDKPTCCGAEATDGGGCGCR
jgi:hypothetical protein